MRKINNNNNNNNNKNRKIINKRRERFSHEEPFQGSWGLIFKGFGVLRIPVDKF